jgi:hypothetical protein
MMIETPPELLIAALIIGLLLFAARAFGMW